MKWNRVRTGGVLLLPLTESGARMGSAETVTFDDELVLRLLHRILPLRHAHPCSSHADSDAFRALWRQACQYSALTRR